MRFHLEPDQPFGTEAGGGRTAVRGKAASISFNANTGQHFITSEDPLQPLDVRIEAPNQVVRAYGSTLEVRERFATLERLSDMVIGLFIAVPPLLNVRFSDPPIVARVDGEIAAVPFRWELAQWTMHFATTTQDKQEEAITTAWEWLTIVSGLKGRRLLAALHYFHVAVRLDRSALVVGEFMAETLLNLAKTLEVLFPPSGGGKSRDAVRVGLRSVGYDDEAIERHFLPAIALRNEIDVGHVSLALFTRDQLRVIHAYTEVAETAFRDMLERVMRAVQEQRLDIPEYTDTKPSPTTRKVVERLASAFELASKL